MNIVLRNIQKTYGSGEAAVSALKDINLNISKNEFLTISGPSGSGKTTLMAVMAGLLTPDEGDVDIGEYSLYQKDFTAEERAALRNQSMGFVFQSFHLFPYLNALENVMIPLAVQPLSRKDKENTAAEVLRQVGLEDRLKHKPGELSGGQQQRVALARALVNKPEIIFADEPTGNLDTRTKEKILNLFREIHQQGKTILMVTHEATDFDGITKRIKLVDGEIR